MTKPVVYACFPARTSSSAALLAREEERILGEIQAAFEGADLDDPETTLIEGYTGFLRAVAASPDVYRLIFLGEGGGNAAVAQRIQRGREAQVEALSALARGWLEARGRALGPPSSTHRAAARQRDRGPRRVGRPPAALGEPDGWTPETLGRELGRLAAARPGRGLGRAQRTGSTNQSSPRRVRSRKPPPLKSARALSPSTATSVTSPK